MPLGRRRKSTSGEGKPKECIGNRMTIDPKDAGNEFKSSRGGNKYVEGSADKPESAPGPSQIQSRRNSRGTNITRFNSTRSRIVKRPRWDLSPPESPVKKTAKETKSNTPCTPETKTKRQWELWSTEDKYTFYEGLFEHGKDFDAIQNVIAQKCKKKGVAPQLIKNKDQVRHFYYRTWHKISKFVHMDKETKKETQELYGLINYGVLWKKHKAALNDKNGLKLDDLIHTGSTTIKVKGKNFSVKEELSRAPKFIQRIIKTPICNALKKLNNIEDPKPDEDERVQVPDRILLDINPRTNKAWAYVQEMAQNPRLRMMLKPDKKLSSIIKFLSQKWKPHRLKLKEHLEGESQMDKDLTLFPHQECDVVPISLKATKEPRVPIAFNDYKENLLSSPSVGKGKKGDASKNQADNSSELNALSVIFDSPKSGKGQTKESVSAVSSSFSVSAMVDDENAMFPDDMMSCSASNKANTETKTGTSNGSENGNVCDKGTSANSAEDNSATDKVVESAIQGDFNPAMNDSGDSVMSVNEKESNKMKEIVEKGWNLNMADNLSIAELYIMFGKDGKLRLEYEWCATPDDQLASKLTNMLRRLIHLATTEFTDFSKTSNNSNSPCQLCGASKAKGAGSRNAAGNKGQKQPMGRYPLVSKMGGEGMVDVGTQTASTLQNKQNENSSQSKDAVFRVPVAGPSTFLQKNPKTNVNQISLHQMELYTNTHKGRRIRPVNRKPMVVQRTLLPKTAPRQMLTFVPMPTSPTVTAAQSSTTIIGQPMGIPVNIQTSIVPAINVPSNNVNMNARILQNSPASGVRNQLPVPVSLAASSSIVPRSQSLQKTLVNPVSGGAVSMASVPVIAASIASQSSENLTSKADKILHASVSPPSISSLLDISLSNIPTDSDNTEKLIDLALDNTSSNNFGGVMLDGSQKKFPSNALNIPVTSSSDNLPSNMSPPHSPSRSLWIGEDTGDMLMTLFTESPLKRTSDAVASANVSSLSNLFNESSRDSFMGRMDMDASLQCMMNENSIDYVAKFAELANHITQNDNTQDSQKKNANDSFSCSRFDDIEGNILSKNGMEGDNIKGNGTLKESEMEVLKVDNG